MNRKITVEITTDIPEEKFHADGIIYMLRAGLRSALINGGMLEVKIVKNTESSSEHKARECIPDI